VLADWLSRRNDNSGRSGWYVEGVQPLAVMGLAHHASQAGDDRARDDSMQGEVTQRQKEVVESFPL
jgi:hypothetical protein